MQDLGILIFTLFRVLVTHASLFIGFVVPVVVELLNKDIHSDRARFAVTIIVCFFAGMLIEWDTIEHFDIKSAEAMFSAITLIFTESQVIFKFYFKNSDFQKVIQEKIGTTRIENPSG